MNKFLGFLFCVPLALPIVLPDRSQPTNSELQAPVDPPAVDAATPQPASLRELLRSGVTVEGPSDREFHCLAQAVYFEARSEPVEGQLAVAQVVLNRVEDPRYPKSICKVVFQNEHRRHRCQFSFACDGRSDTPFEARAWDVAQRIALIAVDGLWRDVTGAATHYHADYSRPYWRTRMVATAQHGQHLFYRDGAM